MKSTEIRQRFLDFFKDRDHAVIPSASLIPKDDPSVLFTTAGMQPLVPYLLGGKHPEGKRVVNVQKCVRTQDIEEVGDKTHDTFFEMLGNWSFGDYFKKEAITWSYEFLTDEEAGLGLDPDRLYVTCFAGNDDVPRDEESAEIWQSLGVPEHRIYFLKENWWSPGPDGPCGPDTEMFYDITSDGLGDLDLRSFKEADGRQQVVEIWNDVLMEYEKKDGEVVGKLEQQNVDTGAGLERLAMVLQSVDSIFATDLFAPIMERIDELKEQAHEQSERIVADHIRTASFIIAAGVQPDNTGRGYVLRRLLRRAVQHADKLGMQSGDLLELVPSVVSIYKKPYPEISDNEALIVSTIEEEEGSFRETLERGRAEFTKINGDISGKQAFDLYQTHGLPLEITLQLAEEKGVAVDVPAFEEAMKDHKEKSQAAGSKQFAGGLADSQEETVKLHTATHLLNQALRDVLGDHVAQEGSNITTERLRFDFTHDEALTEEEIAEIERIVNEKIQSGLEVRCEERSVERAKENGAIYLPQADYPDTVTVYEMAHPESHEHGGVIYSREICMGPHVENTRDLGTFKITKEESSSAGIRRIKAILEST
ncbi:MAG: alanine--tRNA ligase [Candidatus Paceibacterota bacterium]